MKHSIRILIASATAAMMLSACSGGGTDTTAPPDTTTPLTSPVTLPSTAAPPATQPSTTANQTTAPASLPPATTTAGPAEPDHEVAAAFRKSADIMAAIDSYRITTTTETSVFGQATETTSIMDYFPKLKRYKMTMEVEGMTMETYVIDDQIYSQMPDGSWTKMTMAAPEMTPGESLDQIHDVGFFDLFIHEKTSNGYVLKTRRPLTIAEMMKLGTAAGNVGGTQDPEGLGELGEDLEMSYEMEIRLDDSYRNEETHMKILMKLGEMDMDSQIRMVYSDFNSVAPFELPATAENAKEISIPEP